MPFVFSLLFVILHVLISSFANSFFSPFCLFLSGVTDPLSLSPSQSGLFKKKTTLHLGLFFLPSFHPPSVFHSSRSVSSIPLAPPRVLSLSPDGFRLLSWWGRWPVWRLGCLVSRAIRADVARRGRSELSASASPRVTFHGQLVSEQRRARRLSALLIVKINGNQSPHSTLHSLSPPLAAFTSLPQTLRLSSSLSECVASLCFWVFPPRCAFAALWLTAAVWQYVIGPFLSLHYTLFDLLSPVIEQKSYNARRHTMLLFFLCKWFHSLRFNCCAWCLLLFSQYFLVV